MYLIHSPITMITADTTTKTTDTDSEGAAPPPVANPGTRPLIKYSLYCGEPPFSHEAQLGNSHRLCRPLSYIIHEFNELPEHKAT